MATTVAPAALNRGGAFLTTTSRPEDIFTPADLTDDQRLIGQTAEEFVAKEVVPEIPAMEAHKEGVMAKALKKAGEIGLLGGAIPEAYGGSGLDKVSATVLAEKLSGYASFAVSQGGHSSIGTIPIVYFGTEDQKKKYLPRIATGELLSCYCLSEPQAGSDSLAARTRAVLSPDGKNWILNGQKMWITNGGFADVFIVFAKVDGEKFSCFIVEKGTPGFSVGPEEKKMGIRGSSTVPIFFENAPVPKENLLHEIGRGHIVAFNTLNVGRFSLGASCLGGSKHVLAASSKYSKERHAFGKPLHEFGLIKSYLGEMAIRMYAVESMIYPRREWWNRRSQARKRAAIRPSKQCKCSRNTRSKVRLARWSEAKPWIIAWTRASRFLAVTAFMKIIPSRARIATAASIVSSKARTKSIAC